jgi:hypothetical protein
VLPGAGVGLEEREERPRTYGPVLRSLLCAHIPLSQAKTVSPRRVISGSKYIWAVRFPEPLMVSTVT